MGWPTYQCHLFGLVLLCFLNFDHVTTTLPQTSPQIFSEATEGHNTTINPILDVSAEVSKVDYFRTAFKVQSSNYDFNFFKLNKTTTSVTNFTTDNVNSDDSKTSEAVNKFDNLRTDQNNNTNFYDSSISEVKGVVTIDKESDKTNSVDFNNSTITKAQSTDVLYESTHSNLINYNDIIGRITTQFNNIIPQFPFIRELPLDAPVPTETRGTTFQSSITENVTTLPVDSSTKMNDKQLPITENVTILPVDSSTKMNDKQLPITENVTTLPVDSSTKINDKQLPITENVTTLPVDSSTKMNDKQLPITENVTTLPVDSTTKMNDNSITFRTTTESHVKHELLSEVMSHDYNSQDTHETSSTYIQSLKKTTINRSSEASDVFATPRYMPDMDLITDSTSDNHDYLNDIFLEISLTSSGDSLVVNWLFATNYTQISGFQVSYRMNNREDFDSSSLGISARSFTLHSLHEDENYVICVHVMVNNTLVKNSCEEWSKSSMKIVVGIMAGVVFLVPFVTIIVWIIYKDSKMKRKIEFHKLNEDPNICDDNLLYLRISKDSNCHKHSENGRKIIYDNLEKNVASSCKSLNDAGHEHHCCEHATEETINDEVMNEPWKGLSKQEVEVKACASNEVPLPDISGTTVYNSNKVGSKDSSNSSDRLSRHSNQKEMTSSLHEVI